MVIVKNRGKNAPPQFSSLVSLQNLTKPFGWRGIQLSGIEEKNWFIKCGCHCNVVNVIIINK